jgi:hypothetical protein
MKKKILEALKAKFTGVSDSVLDRIATKAANTVTKEEDVASYVEGVTLQQVIDSYADGRATDAAKSAVTTYEEKHKLKDGEKIGGGPDPKPDPKPKEDGDDIEAKIQAAVAAAITPLTQKLEGYEQKEKSTLRQSFITDKAKELLIPEWRIAEGFNIVDTDDDASIITKLTAVKQNLVTAGLDKKETGLLSSLSSSEALSKEAAKDWAKDLPDM